MIAVFGATGQTGSEVTRQLAVKGVPIRALVHKVEKAGALEGPGVEVVQVDLTKPETLEPALQGVDQGYFVTSGEVIRLFESFYRAAKQAGVSPYSQNTPSTTNFRVGSVTIIERLFDRSIAADGLFVPHF